MNVAIDATAILGPMSKNRGIGNYAFDLFKTMIENDPDNQYFFFNLIEEYSLSEQLNHPGNVHDCFFYTGENHFLINDSRYKAVIGDIIRNFIDEHQIDVFLVTSPFESTVVTYEKEWFENTKVISIVYDIIPYVMKEQYLATKEMYRWYMERVEMLRWMERCLVISQSVKDDMVKHLNFDPEKIDVIYGATSGKFFKTTLSDEQKNEILSKFNIGDRFIMCLGGDDKRKNMDALVMAYAKMPRELIDNYQLVIVCRLSDETLNRLLTLSRENGVSGRVVFTNFVTDEELLRLYNMASLMAFPSQYEGFGLPIVEAWACGVPVLTSNNSSLGEIAGDAAVLVNPFDVNDITRGLVTALQDDVLSDLAARGEVRVKEFTWQRSANLVFSALGKIDFSSRDQKPAKRIAFFTPLPPIKSGISDYSVDIVNALSAYYDIDVFIDGGYQAQCTLADNVRVFNHHKFSPKNYKTVIYQVGNSPYHTYMFSYIQKCGGIVELHDENLHLIADHYATYTLHDKALYRKYLLEDYSKEQVDALFRDARKLHSREKAEEMPLNGFVTNYADRVIVHSRGAKENLLRKNIHRQVETILHYAKVEPLEEGGKANAALGLPHDSVVIAAFGFIQETKRPLPALKAFGRVCAQYPNAHFCFVGEPDEPTDKLIKTYLKQNDDLKGKVTVTGYVDLDRFRQYIDATDICINLRHPYNGETSGSLMRILAKGKCVIVNDIGSFGEIPDDCCVKIPAVSSLSEEEEVDAIYGAMTRLIADADLRQSYGKNAYKYAQDNLDIPIVVKQFVKVIESNRRPALNEEMLSSIIRRLRGQGYRHEQVKALAETLAYSKNSRREPGVKPAPVNVTNIMDKIKGFIQRAQ